MSKNLIRILISGFALLAMSLLSCQSKQEDHSDSYNFTVNGCETKEHKFTASSADDVKNQICAALKDSRVNNGCAAEERKKMFDEKCAGMDWFN